MQHNSGPEGKEHVKKDSGFALGGNKQSLTRYKNLKNLN